jgi:phosphate transport system permease protein
MTSLPSADVAPTLTTTLSFGRRFRAKAMVIAAYVALAVAIVPMLFVVWTVLSKGGHIIGSGFLTKDLPVQARSAKGGIGPAVLGTLLITGVASLLAIPIGVLAAIYLVHYGKGSRLASLVRFLSDVMAGVPSIVMGLFIFTVWVVHYKQRSGLAGALALACLMLPIVIRSTETMLRLVPQELSDASEALGARKARTVLTVVLPPAIPGIVSGCLLAVARAAGETAPLLFTIGLTYTRNAHLSGENTALSTQIFSNASTSFVAAQQRAWGAAFTLIALVLVLSVVARLVTNRFSRSF